MILSTDSQFVPILSLIILIVENIHGVKAAYAALRVRRANYLVGITVQIDSNKTAKDWGVSYIFLKPQRTYPFSTLFTGSQYHS